MVKRMTKSITTYLIFCALMLQQCCSAFYAGSCFDKDTPDGKSNCPQVKHLCQNKVFHKLMLDQCPLTCGFCRAA
ncbi:unnamed protein product [Enterobius vermicularis]|uniref:ShKT domain-containing protein n=1 Tax=Enterobius vermicularis TaxID=51028 RepID=A0A0N4VBM3_ENTVE|nr:unnamed protein product [Enterobius vermicularis]